MADYQTFYKLYCSAHPSPGLATSDISISSNSPRCYKICWSITLKDLSVTRQITSFLKIYEMSIFGEGSKMSILWGTSLMDAPQEPHQVDKFKKI